MMMMTTTMMTMEPRLQFRLGPIPFIHSLSYKEDYFGSATSVRADSFQHNMVIECRSRPVIRCLPASRRAEAAYKLKKYLWTRSYTGHPRVHCCTLSLQPDWRHFRKISLFSPER